MVDCEERSVQYEGPSFHALPRTSLSQYGSGRPVTMDQQGAHARPEPNWQALLAVATELERWLATMPTWSDQSWEAWEVYSRRHSKREQELAKRLARLPGCTITRSANGAATTLLLGLVEMRSHTGLTGACRDWIAEVRGSAKDKVQQMSRLR
jgi:hypothetical protein